MLNFIFVVGIVEQVYGLVVVLLGSCVVIPILDHSNCFVVSDLSVFLPKRM